MDLPLSAMPTFNRLARTPSLRPVTPWQPMAGREMRFSCRSSSYHTAAATLPGCLVVRSGSKRWKPRRVTLAASWTTPSDYNWKICTQLNYAQQVPFELAEGPLSAARRLVDTSYHGHYTLERQQFQDGLVTKLVDSVKLSCREPLLIFTAGAMGVGKTHVIRWMKEEGILPLDDFVYINPDHLAKQLPEYQNYVEQNRASAAVMTRLEAGLLTELSLMYALQQKRNLLVDSSLRHGSWYSRVLEKLRQKLPEVRVVLMYVHAREETVYQRAIARGVQGRMVSRTEVADSLERLPLAIQKLLPNVDTFLQVDNNDATPALTSICQQARAAPEGAEGCDVNPEAADGNGWANVRGLLKASAEPGEPLSEAPEILPSSGSGADNPLTTLFQTIQFAALKHQNQTRKNPQQTPYINHPLAVARILAESGVRDLATLQAALLHDTLEDTDATRAELDAAFGSKVGSLVAELTDEEGLRPLHQKFRQLRRVKSLPLQAKLVRIADKMHNVWDLMHHGIPGWSQGKTERYVAWACEMVEALRGTHAALEERFHSEVSLPKGYQIGDWEEFAVQEMGWRDLEDLSDGADHDGKPPASPLAEHRAVLSLLRAAEHVASQSEEQLMDSVKFALLLTNHSIKDPETLKAALLLGTADGSRWVARQFGSEVANILREVAAEQPRSVQNHKARRLLLGKSLYELRKLQVGTISSFEELGVFHQVVERAVEQRYAFWGVHPPLEEGLDAIFRNGQVRLASGELAAAFEPSPLLSKGTDVF